MNMEMEGTGRVTETSLLCQLRFVPGGSEYLQAGHRTGLPADPA